MALMIVILILGVLDQTSPAWVPDYAGRAAAWQADGKFVHTVEARLPDGAMVFQLPYMSFPEAHPEDKMDGYDAFVPYLHSTKLRWSFGAIIWRKTSDWQRMVSEQPAPDMVSLLRKANFAAIWLDRFGHNHEALKQQLDATLGSPALQSDDERYCVWDLRPTATATTAPMQ
jgi:phosphoglycerol transferase